jgi:hypothetical protein
MFSFSDLKIILKNTFLGPMYWINENYSRKKSKKSEASVASLAALALKQKTRCGDSKNIYKQIYDNAYYLHVTRQKNVELKIKKAIDD